MSDARPDRHPGHHRHRLADRLLRADDSAVNVGSLFSGIGGMDLGLARAGFSHRFFCEIDPYRRSILRRHWPGVPVYEDVRAVARDQDVRGGIRDVNGSADTRQGGRTAQRDPDVDLLCGGFPCQDLSVAGARRGLAGDRSGLFFEFARVADSVLPDGGWVLIENVPGLLSSNNGRDFAVLLATLAELGFHDLAWRVLDSRYLGVPQRRRRVFILARRSGGRSASEVLLEPESGGGDFEAGRETRQASARAASGSPGTAGALTTSQERLGDGSDQDFITNHSYYVEDFENGTLTSSKGRIDRHPLIGAPADADRAYVTHSLTSEGFDASEDGTGRGTPLVPDRVRTPPGATGRVVGAMTFETRVARNGRGAPSDTVNALKREAGGTGRGDAAPMVFGGVEGGDRCAVDPRPDGPRYAACGDAVTVNVAQWIGERLMAHAADSR